jgi:putative transposase
MLPRRNVRRMAPVWTASCVDSFESFERFERHTGFELSAVRFPLCRPLPSPHFHLLWTQQAILIICPVFGVHYNYLWRAVDQDDNVLDILVQSRRNKQAAKKFFRKLLKGLQYVPRVIITDKLKSYGAAKRELLPGVDHWQSRYLNNRCENSHRPTRQREYRMQGFKSPGHARRFLAVYGPVAQHFRPRRHLLSAPAYRQEMRNRFESWAAITGTERAA